MKKGFTLIELLVVIAIIAIISGLVIVRISAASIDARNSQRKNDLNAMKGAIDIYRANGGKLIQENNIWSGSLNISYSKENCDIMADGFDKNGKKPSDYLPEGKCVFDPKYKPGPENTYLYIYEASYYNNPKESYCLKTESNPELNYEVCY